MALVREAIGTVAVGTTGTTVAVPYPTPGGGILAGWLLVIKTGVSSVTLPTLTAGWTDGVSATASGSLSPSFRTQVKLAAGGETGSVSVTVPTVGRQAWMEAWSGVDQTTPLDVAGSAAGFGAVTAFDIPGVTTTTPGVGLSYMGVWNATTGTNTPPTVPAAFAEDVDSVTNAPGSTGGFLIWSGSGATGTINLVRSTSIRGAAGVIAIRPAAVTPALPIIVLAPRR